MYHRNALKLFGSFSVAIRVIFTVYTFKLEVDTVEIL